jgi:hypothetical protein
MNTSALRSMPVIAYTRMFYAVVILIKLALAVQNPNSSIGVVLDLVSLKTTFYLNVVTNALQTAVGLESFVVPSTFLSIMNRLTAWHQRQQSMLHIDEAADELFEPMAFLSTREESGSPARSIAIPSEETPVYESQTSISLDSDNQPFGVVIPSNSKDYSPGNPSWLSAGYPSATSTGMYNLPLHHNESQIYSIGNDLNIQDSIPWSQQMMDFGFNSNTMGQTFEDSFVSFPSNSEHVYRP